MAKEKSIRTKAVAIGYEPGKNAIPTILALGEGEIANKIIEKANQNSIPVVEDAKSADILNMMNVGDVIPVELYEAIAKILVFIADVDNKYKKG